MSRVKLAYRLNEHEAQGLLNELSPDGVFPYEIWQKAYSTYWKYPAAEISKLYKVGNPPFPETHAQSIKHCPTDVYAKWMVDFFFEMARRIHHKDLQKGFDYIVEMTYDDKFAVSETDRGFLFYHMGVVDKNIATVARTEGLKDINPKLSSPDVLLNIFPDTVVVDTISAIHYLSVVQKYPFYQEVKGITHDLVKYVVKRAAEGAPLTTEAAPPLDEPAPETQFPKPEGMTLIPRSLWEEKKSPQQVCDDMRVAGYTEDAPIAHALYYWVGIKNFTKIGTILRGDEISESARDKHARKHWKLAEGRYYTE